MSLFVFATGTQSAVIGTEHSLSTNTNGKTCICQVDSTNMVSGDTLELRAYVKVLTGGTKRCVYYDVFTGAQNTADIAKISVPVAGLYYVEFTLKQTAGTGRSYDWSVMTID